MMKRNKREHTLTVTTFTIAGVRSYMLWNHKKGKISTRDTKTPVLQEYARHTKSSHQQMAVLRTWTGHLRLGSWSHFAQFLIKLLPQDEFGISAEWKIENHRTASKCMQDSLSGGGGLLLTQSWCIDEHWWTERLHSTT